MGLTAYKKNDRIHAKGTPVKTVEVVLSGSVTLIDGTMKMTLGQGNILGAVETPGSNYMFDYIASDDCKIGAYPYRELEDIEKVIRVNPRIAPILATAMVRAADESYKTYEAALANAKDEYVKLKKQIDDYPGLSASLGESVKEFPELKHLEGPRDSAYLVHWMVVFLKSVREHDDYLNKYVYTQGPDMILGFVMGAARFMKYVVQENQRLRNYVKEIHEISMNFQTVYMKLEQKMREINAVDEISADSDETPDLSNALNVILSFGEIPATESMEFKNLIETYGSYSDRGEMSDVMRKLRREITDAFFRIYSKVFLNSLETTSVPPAVKMFLMFGFVDPQIAGQENTDILYQIVKNHKPDAGHVVYTVPEWLEMIYRGEVMPSKNEFDLDYPAHLREQKQNGEITEEQEKELLVDPVNKVKFETENMFKIGDRMTFGRITSFIPIFDSCNVMKALDTAYLATGLVHEKLNAVRSLDYSIFYREQYYSNEDLGITRLTIDKEVLPYMIMMPNMGSRVALWQEIEGKKRDTRARFLLPMFTVEDPIKSFISACGEFRWEMCKTEQGIHWNDLSDPSLTAEYADYIQFYRKNRLLNAEQKEKLKKTLQKVGNNLRRAFVSDYLLYMTAECNGSPVMNKASRAILFSYVPFGAEIRAKIGTNPQYAEFMKKHDADCAAKMRPIEMMIRKLETRGEEIPAELLDQKRYLSM
ncbi:hypothetical protein SAMN02910453_0839 [Lachnospiraceae bacterium A10]|nr:hypothetical protein SAMN02910453_0839 [Lachnospiraceae bacterium A10]